MAKAQLGAIAVGRGPGAFTGVHLAIAIAQGGALALDRPVAPVSTLAALAAGARSGASRDVADVEAFFAQVGAASPTPMAVRVPDRRGRRHELRLGLGPRPTGRKVGFGEIFVPSCRWSAVAPRSREASSADPPAGRGATTGAFSRSSQRPDRCCHAWRCRLLDTSAGHCLQVRAPCPGTQPGHGGAGLAQVPALPETSVQ